MTQINLTPYELITVRWLDAKEVHEFNEPFSVDSARAIKESVGWFYRLDVIEGIQCLLIMSEKDEGATYAGRMEIIPVPLILDLKRYQPKPADEVEVNPEAK